LHFQGVYALDLSKPGSPRLVADDFEKPNGLAFSPDETVMYVSDTSRALHEEAGNHHIVAFDVVDGVRLERPRVFAVIEPGVADGFRVDPAGNVFTSSAAGIIVYSSEGAELTRIEIPEVASNCCFDPGQRRLFVTASTSLYAIDLA
jgi:gluconolactonase